MKRIFIGLLAIGVMIIASSLLANNSSQKSMDDLASLNLEALDESAGDAMCDATNDKECKFWTSSGMIGRGTGNMHIWQ